MKPLALVVLFICLVASFLAGWTFGAVIEAKGTTGDLLSAIGLESSPMSGTLEKLNGKTKDCSIFSENLTSINNKLTTYVAEVQQFDSVLDETLEEFRELIETD